MRDHRNARQVVGIREASMRIILAVLVLALAGCQSSPGYRGTGNTLGDIGMVLSSTANGMRTYAPPRPVYQPPSLTTIMMPSGRMVSCTTTGTVTNCF